MNPTDRIRTLESELNGAFYERRDEIRSILTALIAGEHVLLLGPPGTAKSALVNAVSGAFAGSCFSVLMTRFSVPEEVFGPISLKGLENDEYRRVTAGYLPSAQFTFLDEIFKANSSILNALLTALNERAFDDGGKRIPIPLELAVGASNELPQDTALQALYDRFVLRHWVGPIRSRSSLRTLLGGTAEPTVRSKLEAGDLSALRALVEQVELPDSVLDTVLDLKAQLEQEHGIEASDRRWRKCIRLVRAHAVIEGRAAATHRDLMILAHALWDDPEQRPAIHGAIASKVNPDLQKALRIQDAATELLGNLDMADSSARNAGVLAQANHSLRDMAREARSLANLHSGDPEIGEIAEKVQGLQRELAMAASRHLLGDM